MRAQRRKAGPKSEKHMLGECAQWKPKWTCHKSHFVSKFTGKMPDPKPARGILCGDLQEKCRTRSPPAALCVEIYRKNAGPRFRGQRFVRACAAETHMDMSHEPFYAVIDKEKCLTPFPGSTFCASLRSRNTHGHFTRAM